MAEGYTNGHHSYMKHTSIVLGVAVALLVVCGAIVKVAIGFGTLTSRIAALDRDVERLQSALNKADVHNEKVQEKNEFRISILERRIGTAPGK